jgi:hypothetical protein
LTNEEPCDDDGDEEEEDGDGNGGGGDDDDDDDGTRIAFDFCWRGWADDELEFEFGF